MTGIYTLQKCFVFIHRIKYCFILLWQTNGYQLNNKKRDELPVKLWLMPVQLVQMFNCETYAGSFILLMVFTFFPLCSWRHCSCAASSHQQMETVSDWSLIKLKDREWDEMRWDESMFTCTVSSVMKRYPSCPALFGLQWQEQFSSLFPLRSSSGDSGNNLFIISGAWRFYSPVNGSL